jgi:hypothetical protein
MLYLIPYALIFWIFAILSTLLKATRENEISFYKERLSTLPQSLFIVVKFIPALTAVITVLLFRPTAASFTFY